MSQGIQKTARWVLALAMAGTVWAAGNSSNMSASSGSGQSTTGAVSSISAGQDSNANGKGLGQDTTTSNPNSDGKGRALQRKQARVARHAAIDKARQQALDSLKAAFAKREAAEVAGSSESVNKKIQEDKSVKGNGKVSGN